MTASASVDQPHALWLVGYMCLLAALDFTGTLFAKEWALHRSLWCLFGGASAFVALFVVLALGLRWAEMSILTLGWVVVLQSAIILIDRSRYGTTITPAGWVSIVAIIVLQGVLMISGTSSADRGDIAPSLPSLTSQPVVEAD
jgi:peptidoglycan/LPS O-acetylase OafA/YrhL